MSKQWRAVEVSICRERNLLSQDVNELMAQNLRPAVLLNDLRWVTWNISSALGKGPLNFFGSERETVTPLLKWAF